MGTITKALTLLELFSPARPELGLTECARLAGRDKATTHRHLIELEQNGFLEQNAATKAYRLGPAILRLAGVREETFPARTALRPVADDLANAVGELVHISLVQGDTLSPLVYSDPQRHSTRVAYDPSERLPLHATSSGMAVLAFAPLLLAERVLTADLARFTDQTITDPARLRTILDEIRLSGISSLAQSFDSEVVSQAAPVFGPDAAVMGAISIAVPVVRASDDKFAGIVEALRTGVRRATEAVGGVVPERHANLWA